MDANSSQKPFTVRFKAYGKTSFQSSVNAKFSQTDFWFSSTVIAQSKTLNTALIKLEISSDDQHSVSSLSKRKAFSKI